MRKKKHLLEKNSQGCKWQVRGQFMFFFGEPFLWRRQRNLLDRLLPEKTCLCSHQDGRHIHRYSIHIVRTLLIMIHIDLHMIYIRYTYDSTVKRLNQNQFSDRFSRLYCQLPQQWDQSDVHCNDVFLMPGVRQPLHAQHSFEKLGNMQLTPQHGV